MGRRRKKQKITAEFVEKENNEAKSENIKDFNIIDQKTVDISINDDENGMVYTQENRELSSRESSPVSALSMRGKINVVELSDFDVADDSEGIGILTDNEEKYESQEELNEKIYESQTRKKSEKNEVLDSFVVSRFDPSSSNVVCYKEKDDNFDLCLIAMKRGESIRFQGSALVASIYGDAVIMGYRLCGVSFEDASESLQIDLNSSVVFHPVFSPKTHSLLAIESVEIQKTTHKISHPEMIACSTTKSVINKLLSNIDLSKGGYDTILALQGISWCGIQGVENVASCFNNIFSGDLAKNEKKDDESKKSKYDFFNIKGFYPIFEAAPGMTALKIPHSWENSVNQLVADILDFTLPPISITSGHKNVGKSTFSRYLVNNLLNVCPKVAYIESDVGQSEFTPCGLVSLNILDSPIFGPPFTHIQQPYRSYFIGHNSPRDDPDYYLECLRELITVYRRDIACGPEYGMYGDEQIRIPLIINTHGWSKGMGYDLYLHIISFAKPTHIFQFYSATITNKNLPPLPEYIVSPNDQEPPKVSFIETIDTPGPSNKYSASDRRILSLFSYFYSTSAMAIKQENVKWWAFDQPLVRRVPWCLDWRKGLTKGIFMLSGEVPLSQLLYALNGSIVGLIGDIDNSCTIEQVDEEMNESKEEGSQIIPNYFPCPDFSPPSPTECTCLGLAIIRSIDPTSHTFHILTPLPSMVLFKTNTIVKGTLELPVWLMLDHTKNSSLGVHGIQWKRAPYMSIESGGGVGNAAQKIRRNIKRRGQKSNK